MIYIPKQHLKIKKAVGLLSYHSFICYAA